MRMQRDTDGWRSKVATGREHATERASFKSALHETFYRSSKSIAELAELLGVSRQYLQAAADENEPDRHLSGRLFPALATHADNPAWLDHLEACHGRVAFVETAGLTGAAAMPISGPGTSRVMPEAMRGVKRPTGVMDSRGRDSRRDGDQSVHSEGPNGWNRRAL